MEHRFKRLEKGKLVTYSFVDAPSFQEKLQEVIPLHLKGIPNEYIAAELAISHIVVLREVKKYETNKTHSI